MVEIGFAEVFKVRHNHTMDATVPEHPPDLSQEERCFLAINMFQKV
jgi:hypothetical protein